MKESLYDILGVGKSASADEIRKAYRTLARKHHPDVNPGDARAEDTFKKVSAAYDVLSDPDKRKAYDEFGEESLRGGFDPEQARAYKQWQSRRRAAGQPSTGERVDFDLGDLGDLFGYGRRSRGPRKGHDVRGTVELEFEQAIRGAEVQLQISTDTGPKTVTARIPPGADTGSTLRLPGQGGPGIAGGPAGDVVIETVVRPHRLIRRDGLDLHLPVPVTVAEAYDGASIEVPTFDGPVTVKVPPGSQQGQKLRLRGKGVKRGKDRGDLYVQLEVKLPEGGDAEVSEALRRAEAGYRAPVRKGVRL
jgi:DnaJ-class molecular chaperone